ncbi:hypothetical protein RB595_001126 [Gaeumannomyces hyphopodioides]
MGTTNSRKASPALGALQPLNWGCPEKTGAAFDLRSDVVTTPSVGMLEAIAHSTLNDDVYGEDATTADFERQMASLCGHEAAAFVISGTMANQLALRALLQQPPYAILADARSHIIHFEAGGVAHLSGAMVQAVRPLNGRHLTVEDAEKHAVLSDDDVHKCPTRVVSVENTAGGAVVPPVEMRRLHAWAGRHGLALHVDGARLWEAVAAGAGDLRELASCCHALSLDFSKNLGAPLGAMVLGSADLVARLRRLRKGVGGGMRQAGVLAAAARRAVAENFGPGPADTRGVIARSHVAARAIGGLWTARGGRLLRDVETNMVWLDLKGAGVPVAEWNEAGRKHGLKLDGKRIVVHHQLSDAAVAKLAEVMDEVLRLKGAANMTARL